MQIKQLVRENKKSRALLLIQLKKFKARELEKIDEQLLSVLKMIEDIEWESINVQALLALEKGTDALKEIHTYMTPEKLRVLLEDNAEAIEVRIDTCLLPDASRMFVDGESDQRHSKQRGHQRVGRGSRRGVPSFIGGGELTRCGPFTTAAPRTHHSPAHDNDYRDGTRARSLLTSTLAWGLVIVASA